MHPAAVGALSVDVLETFVSCPASFEGPLEFDDDSPHATATATQSDAPTQVLM
jgi:hypothetical protein